MNNYAKILICDDNETLCYTLKEELLEEGYTYVDTVYDGKYAIENLKNKVYDLLLLDLEMPDIKGELVLQFAHENFPTLQVIVLTGEDDVNRAVNCMKMGAYDLIQKPHTVELISKINRALEHKDLVVKNSITSSKFEKTLSDKIIGQSKQMQHLINLALRSAKSDSNILLEGDTGTGKELLAEFIHRNSNIKDKPFVVINCASLPDQLIESELFGHEKGAFTDAKTPKQGLVEIADGGSLFLDEIGEMSLSLQPKLLRFLENGEFRRVGGVTNLNSNVRVICATNKNLMEESERKVFRRDLLFRLNVITLTVPPLRERGEDILLLAEHFLQTKTSIRNPKKLSAAAEKVLMQYNFPGNVRELEHIIERAIIFAEGNTIQLEDLNLPTDRKSTSAYYSEGDDTVISLEDIEKVHIKKALDKNSWNRENTARILGISQKTLYSKIIKYGLRQNE